MAFHKPRFRPIHLLDLGVIMAAEFAILPGSVAIGVMVLSLVTALLVSISGPLTKTEWASIVVTHAILIALLVPAVKHSHGRPRKPKPAPTTAPPSVKIRVSGNAGLALPIDGRQGKPCPSAMRRAIRA